MTKYDPYMSLDHDLVDTFVGRYLGYAAEGLDRIDWYAQESDAVGAFAAATGYSRRWMAGLVAALSPVISVAGNAARVCHAVRAVAAGASWEDAIAALPCTPDSVKTHALKYLAGGYGALGVKTRAFAENLDGNGHRVTVDTWMCKAADVPPAAVKSANSPARLAAEAACHQIAEMFGHKPADVQAAVWYGVRRAHGKQDKADTLGRIFEEFVATGHIAFGSF